MPKSKKIYLSILLIVISCILLVRGPSFITASTTPKFSDVNEENWFLSDVKYVHEKGLMNGTSQTTFSPNDSTTRGMIATVLWRMEGSPKGCSMAFQDVGADAYYKEAVAWCSENNIVIGYSNTLFVPDDFITREQLVTMIYRYANYKGYDITNHDLLSEYSDISDVSEYALLPFEWAITHSIITGTTDNTLVPQGEAQRCQVAAILKRFCTEFGNDSDGGQNSQENQTATPNKPSQSHIGLGNLPDGTSDSSSGGSIGSSSDNTSADIEKTDEDIGVTYPIISTDNLNAKPGDTIQIAINIKNNPGILGMILSVYFNEESLSLEGIQNGTAFSALDLTTSKTLESGLRLIWDGVEIKPEDIKDGKILLMNFKIKDDAKPGKYPITLKYTDGDILDNNLTIITPSVEVGYITVFKGDDAR